VPDKAHVLFGAAVDPSMGDQLSITMVSSLPEDRLYAARSAPIEKPALLEPSVGFAIDEAEPEAEPEAKPVRARKAAAAPVTAAAAEAVVTGKQAAAPFAEPEPSPFTIDHALTPELADDDDFAGVARDVPVLAPEADESPEAPAEVVPVLAVESAAAAVVKVEEEEDDEESPAFFEIADEPEPDEEPVAAVEAGAEADEEVPVVLPGVFDDLDDDLGDIEPVAGKLAASPKLKAGGKGQPELSFEGGPRGKFEGASPSLFEGEDLDVPAFLRKKR